MTENSSKSVKGIWLWATGLALLVNAMLLYRHDGLSAVLVTLGAVGGAGCWRRQRGGALAKRWLAAGIYLVLASGLLLVTTVPEIRFLAGAVLVLGMAVLGMEVRAASWTAWLAGWLESLFGALRRGIGYFTFGRAAEGGRGRLVLQVLSGLLVSVPLAFVALGLLSSADRVFGNMVTEFAALLDGEFVARSIWRLAAFAGVAAFFFGLAVKDVSFGTREPSLAGPEPPKVPVAVSATVLVVLDFIYLVFAYVQFVFLFGGSTAEGAVMGVPGAYHYAEYARQGFFELVALTLLNTAGIIVLHKITQPHKAIRTGLTVTVASNLVMAASSAYKMHLYEAAYGYTRLRLYVYLILAFIAAFMVLQGIALWKDSWKPVEWAAAAGLVYFLAVGYMDTDSFIARANIERFEETGEIDAYYLLGLSEDAWPRVLPFVLDYPEEVSGAGERERLEGILARSEDERLFFEYNIRHAKAKKALQQYSALSQ